METLSFYIFLGIGILLWGGAIFFSLKIIKNRLEQKKKDKIINDPIKLKEKLEENGRIIDDGKEITFNLETDKKTGKEILIAKTIELPINANPKKNTTIPILKNEPDRKLLKKKRVRK